MTDPKKNEPAELAEDQLSEVSGGETVQPILHPTWEEMHTLFPNL